MSLASKTVNNDIITIHIGGRIDANNAAAYGEEIEDLLLGEDGKEVILDIDDLEYISSAGLRVVLKLLKEHKDLKLINASSEVYQIFEMTGFTEMIDIKKAFRKMSIDGCEVIGRGAKGTVYRYNEDTIVKAYNNPDSLPDILRERELARKAFVLGVPTAISYDVVRIGESYGSVFELLDAKSYSKMIVSDEANYSKYVEEYANVLRQIHSTEVKEGDMPSVKGIAYKWVEEDKKHLDSFYINKLTKMIDEVPDRLTMIHGDYHTNNLMLQNGETMIIDMDTLSHGHPVFELANMYTAHILLGLTNRSIVEDFLGYKYDLSLKVWDDFIHLYFKEKSEDEINDIMDKVKILGYARLIRHISRRGINDDMEKRALEIAKERIGGLLKKVDSLAF